MKIVINSHIKSRVPLEHLLESFKEVQCIYEIIVVIGGYYDVPGYKVFKQNDITYIHCNHNSIDFTGLIALLELYNDNVDEYYTYLHDTCKIGKNFFILIYYILFKS